MNNRAGIYKNNLSGDMTYKSFMPAVLPPNPPIELDKDIVELLVKANKQLALLEGISSRIPIFLCTQEKKLLCLLKLRGHRQL